MSPELLGRIDKTIVFNSLDEKSLESIAAIELDSLSERLSKLGYSFAYSKQVPKLAARKVFSVNGSARDVRKLVCSHIEDLISEKMICCGDKKLFLETEKNSFTVRSAVSIA